MRSEPPPPSFPSGVKPEDRSLALTWLGRCRKGQLLPRQTVGLSVEQAPRRPGACRLLGALLSKTPCSSRNQGPAPSPWSHPFQHEQLWACWVRAALRSSAHLCGLVTEEGGEGGEEPKTPSPPLAQVKAIGTVWGGGPPGGIEPAGVRSLSCGEVTGAGQAGEQRHFPSGLPHALGLC